MSEELIVADEVVASRMPEARRVVLTEEDWRAHVAAAEKFSKSNSEYCRRHELDLQAFRAYKKKFRKQRARLEARPGAFVQVQPQQQPVTQPTETRRPASVEKQQLPDPRWTAEFVAALLAAHR